MADTRNYSDIVSDRAKVANGEYTGTIDGVAVRISNVPERNPNSSRTWDAPFLANWKVRLADSGRVIAEGWCSRLGATQSAAHSILRGY